ncbi:putative NAD(P)H-dependent D-xylose reductase xyl1 [Calycina marina]|uniref:NAD(P)H-dependent D-xylose reductase xyl1 n=1 Tax=Calycina marina TaxID=1763456 RepID=A0A9P8CCT1_9HELO|nr:putative NAD(P)H-dependent D-xylose reductase xyl1 [Calycina marina]
MPLSLPNLTQLSKANRHQLLQNYHKPRSPTHKAIIICELLLFEVPQDSISYTSSSHQIFDRSTYTTSSAMSPPTIKLNSGHEMPQVGFGLWKVDNATCADTVYNAIKTGYRLFDGACDYGNEQEAGEGVARAIKDGLVKREELFIVSKLWNTFHEGHQVEPIVKKQLADWGIDYFDLFYIHFPVALKYVDPSVRYPPGWEFDGKDDVQPIGAPIQETWTALEKTVEKGLVKSIAISNFQGSLILDLLRYAKIRPAVLQIEHHPYLVQQTLLTLAKSEGIVVTAYSSFGPQSFVELGWDKAKDTPVLFEHPVVTKIAEKHGKTPAQVLLRWSTQRGLAVIPKSNSQSRLQQNLEVTTFDLDESEIKEISALDKNLRFNNPADYLGTLHIFA